MLMLIATEQEEHGLPVSPIKRALTVKKLVTSLQAVRVQAVLLRPCLLGNYPIFVHLVTGPGPTGQAVRHQGPASAFPGGDCVPDPPVQQQADAGSAGGWTSDTAAVIACRVAPGCFLFIWISTAVIAPAGYLFRHAGCPLCGRKCLVCWHFTWYVDSNCAEYSCKPCLFMT